MLLYSGPELFTLPSYSVFSEQTVPMIKTENKTTEEVTTTADGAIHVKAPTFDGSSHWAT